MRPRGKYFDLNNNDDIQAVLDLLNESDADFSDDDDINDENWVPFNIFPEAEASDEDEDTFASTLTTSCDLSSGVAQQTTQPSTMTNVLPTQASGVAQQITQPSTITNVSSTQSSGVAQQTTQPFLIINVVQTMEKCSISLPRSAHYIWLSTRSMCKNAVRVLQELLPGIAL